MLLLLFSWIVQTFGILALVPPLAGGSRISYRVGLSAMRAAAARYDLEAFNLVPDVLVEDGVGQEDQPVRAGVSHEEQTRERHGSLK
jgi:hypothetical protein